MEKSTNSIIWKAIGTTALSAVATVGSMTLALNRINASEKLDNEHSKRDEIIAIGCTIATGMSLVFGCIKTAKLGVTLADAMKEARNNE